MRLTAQPLHMQLRRALMKRIASGEWKHGDVIPNENEIAREFNLSPGTVRKALDWMEQARIVVRQQGRGTFVTDPASPELAARFERLHTSDGQRIVTIPTSTAVEIGKPTAPEQAALKLSASASVLRIRQTRRYGDGTTAIVEEVALSADLFAGLTDAMDTGYDIVQASKHCMVLLGEGRETLSVVIPPEHVGAVFGLPDDEQVLLLVRTIDTIDGVPAEFRRAWCRLGDNTYRVELV